MLCLSVRLSSQFQRDKIKGKTKLICINEVFAFAKPFALLHKSLSQQVFETLDLEVPIGIHGLVLELHPLTIFVTSPSLICSLYMKLKFKTQ